MIMHPYHHTRAYEAPRNGLQAAPRRGTIPRPLHPLPGIPGRSTPTTTTLRRLTPRGDSAYFDILVWWDTGFQLQYISHQELIFCQVPCVVVQKEYRYSKDAIWVLILVSDCLIFLVGIISPDPTVSLFFRFFIL